MPKSKPTSEMIGWFQIRDKKGACNFRCRLFKVSASTNFSAIANLLLGHAAGIVQHECEFAAAGSDRCNRPSAVAVVVVCHLIGVGFGCILTLGELSRYGLFAPELDLYRALLGFRDRNRICALLDYFITDLAIEVERAVLLTPGLGISG